ncbi:Protein CBG26220 [Caenorhabditis briggsae]|uniref:Protein CBG26220 n=1 Tax=Caenorhabditis briggsae TaxID=6238 RepID=B6IEM8_CAEBR|nr:Protein CBG26220 [Caenorhabditis briggsae]CAR98358.1 Protein CBG26220 [Caenorhabditis briggsae]
MHHWTYRLIRLYGVPI